MIIFALEMIESRQMPNVDETRGTVTLPAKFACNRASPHTFREAIDMELTREKNLTVNVGRNIK